MFNEKDFLLLREEQLRKEIDEKKRIHQNAKMNSNYNQNKYKKDYRASGNNTGNNNKNTSNVTNNYDFNNNLPSNIDEFGHRTDYPAPKNDEEYIAYLINPDF